MKLNQITLSAFGSFAKEITIDFRPVQGGLFLISGDTGAGKTTILDGISYALFEETSGGIREGAMMRSQYADSATPTFVELEFEYHNGTYRIRRNPTYKRLSKRKDKEGREKLTDEPASVTLTMPDGTEFRGRKEETNQKIVEILGITARQFSSIAMIAQGKFTRLLFASSKERREIFAQLFDTELYGRVQKRLAELAGELEEELTTQDIRYQDSIRKIRLLPDSRFESQWQSLPNEHLNESIDEVLQLVLQICRETEQEEEECRKVREAQDDFLDGLKKEKEKAETQLEWIQKRNLAEGKKQELLSRQEEMEKLGQQIRTGEQVRKLKPLYDSWKRKKQEYGEQRKEWQTAKAQLEEQAEEVRKAKERWTSLEEQGKVRLQELEPELNRLQNSMEQYREWSRIQEQYDKQQELQKELAEGLEQNQSRQNQIREEIHQLELENQRLTELSLHEAASKGMWENSRRELEAVTVLMENWKKWIEKLGMQEEQEDAFHTAEDNWKQAKEQYDKGLDIYLKNQAGMLAKDLKAMQPCPVCGSLEHPRLAELQQEHLTQEELEHKKQTMEQAEQAYRLAAANHREWKTELRQQALQLSGEGVRLNIPNWFQFNEEEWNPEEKDQDAAITRLTKELKKVEGQKQQACAEADETWKQAVAAGKKQKEQEARITDFRKKLEEQTKAEQEERHRLESVREQVISLQAQEENILKHLPYPSEDEAKQALEAGSREQEKWQKERKEAEECYRTGQEEWKRLEGVVTSKEREVKRLEQEEEQRYRQLEGELGQSDFLSPEEYQEREWYIEKLEEWRSRIQQYESELAASQKECQIAREQAGEQEAYSLEPLEQQLREAEQKRKELELRWHNAASMSQTNREIYQQLQELCKDYQDLVRQRNIYQTLNRTANGTLQGKSKLDFQTYIQRYYFERMIRAANQRMKDMTNGTLYLQCRAIEALQIQGEAGLDLDVYSTELNQVRDVKTLSGGESFQAALAMALGMSDIIQETVGRIQMDTLFIDEGFGSLDEDARRMAIEKLYTMTGNRQTVGIISHVSELREEITHTLYVKKDKHGSSVSWK